MLLVYTKNSKVVELAKLGDILFIKFTSTKTLERGECRRFRSVAEVVSVLEEEFVANQTGIPWFLCF